MLQTLPASFAGVDGFSFTLYLRPFIYFSFSSSFLVTSLSIYSPQKVLLMVFVRFCILMPQFEEYIANSSLDPGSEGDPCSLSNHCRISFAIYLLSSTCLSPVYIRPHAFPSDMSPFCTEPSSPNSAARVQANAVAVPSDPGCMYRSFCQNVCFYVQVFR